MNDLRDKINELKLNAQVSPLGATCDNNLFFNTLSEIEDYLDTIDNANPYKALGECFRVWKCDNEDELLVEIFSEDDLLSVQKEFVNKGFVIVKYDYAFGEVFLQVVRSDTNE